MLPALLCWWLRWTCSWEPTGVVEYVTDNEEEPAGDAKDHRQHPARGVVFRILGVLPEEPIGRKEHQADRRDMLLEIEEALRLPISSLLNGDADVGAILDVDVRAHDEGEDQNHA